MGDSYHFAFINAKKLMQHKIHYFFDGTIELESVPLNIKELITQNDIQKPFDEITFGDFGKFEDFLPFSRKFNAELIQFEENQSGNNTISRKRLPNEDEFESESDLNYDTLPTEKTKKKREIKNKGNPKLKYLDAIDNIEEDSASSDQHAIGDAKNALDELSELLFDYIYSGAGGVAIIQGKIFRSQQKNDENEMFGIAKNSGIVYIPIDDFKTEGMDELFWSKFPQEFFQKTFPKDYKQMSDAQENYINSSVTKGNSNYVDPYKQRDGLISFIESGEYIYQSGGEPERYKKGIENRIVNLNKMIEEIEKDPKKWRDDRINEYRRPIIPFHEFSEMKNIYIKEFVMLCEQTLNTFKKGRKKSVSFGDEDRAYVLKILSDFIESINFAVSLEYTDYLIILKS
jgi:hypothetical protein